MAVRKQWPFKISPDPSEKLFIESVEKEYLGYLTNGDEILEINSIPVAQLYQKTSLLIKILRITNVMALTIFRQSTGVIQVVQMERMRIRRV